MPRRIESLFVEGPAGKLEALLEEPEDSPSIEAALICHPHPLHGGTMHNKVVYRLARALRKTGCVVLRFNFRGVNLSAGEHANGPGEVEDARSALRELQSRYPDLPVMLAGFSFGSRIALRLTSQEAAVKRVIAVGFPTKGLRHDFVHRITVPKYFVHSTHDVFGPREEMTAFYQGLPEPKQIHWIDSVDHFFKDALDEYESVIVTIGQQRGQVPGVTAESII